MTKAPVLLLFVAFSFISPAQPEWHVPNLVELNQADQIKNHKPPLSTQELRAVRKITTANISECGKEPAFENQCGENQFQSLRVRRVTIGADKAAALAVQGWGDSMCGVVGNCPFWLLQMTPSGYRLLLSARGIQTFAIFESGVAGNYDIVTGSHDSALRTYLAKYSFDNQRYRRAGCAVISYQNEKFEQIKTPRIIPGHCN